MDTFTVGGHGGSGKDTSNTGVRITHLASGAVGECREERSQLQNKRTAFRRMGESKTFQTWARLTAVLQSGQKTPEEWVEEQMKPENIRIEVKDDKGRWTIGEIE